jgi:outer membrane lipoprotein carrier protein
MDIKETASGTLLVKIPGMMRWDYETPDQQIIVSNGIKLWIYRPADNQVLVGKSPTFFGKGKGAGFLSDFQSVRNNFVISLEKKPKDDVYILKLDVYILKLIPHQKTEELSRVYLVVSPATFEISEVVTYNAYGDETRIELSDYAYNRNYDDSVFQFSIPQGADVVELDQ